MIKRSNEEIVKRDEQIAQRGFRWHLENLPPFKQMDHPRVAAFRKKLYLDTISLAGAAMENVRR